MYLSAMRGVRIIIWLCRVSLAVAVGPVIFSPTWRTLVPFLQEPSNEKYLDKAYETAQALDHRLYKQFDAPDIDGRDDGGVARIAGIGRSFLGNILKLKRSNSESNAPAIHLQEDDLVGQHLLIEKTLDPEPKEYPPLLSTRSLRTAYYLVKRQPKVASFLAQFLPPRFVQLAKKLERDIPTALQLQRTLRDILILPGNHAKDNSSDRNKYTFPKGSRSEKMRVELRPNGLVRIYSSKYRPLLGSRLFSAAERKSILEESIKQFLLQSVLRKAPSSNSDSSSSFFASLSTHLAVIPNLFTSTIFPIVASSPLRAPVVIMPPRSGWGEWTFSADKQMLLLQLQEDKHKWRYRYEAKAQVKSRPMDGGYVITLSNGEVFRKKKGRLWWERTGVFKEIE